MTFRRGARIGWFNATWPFATLSLSEDSVSLKVFTLGRIAVATDGETSPTADQTYRRMRSWLKQRYTNRLVAENAAIPGSSTACRKVWLGPDARAKHHRGVALRSNPGEPVVWKEEP